MKRCNIPILVSLILVLSFNISALAEVASDSRADNIGHLDQPNSFHKIANLKEWNAYSRELRRSIRIRMGLWPPPPRCDPKAEIFGRMEFSDFTVDKVYFRSLPGFYVTGNLYCPLELKRNQPGILCPHGHWGKGRLQSEVTTRCINLARQGNIVFSYDMIGYNDSKQLSHRGYDGKLQELWGLTMAQLQLWNSIRAVDFLITLPGVDTHKVGCTGASGGGTQTFMLCAVEERIKVAAPVNMISGHFQGGCICENPPSLRLDTYNVEIAALFAPKPLFMVSCTGDWTKNTPRVEFPLVQGIYDLYGKKERVANYHQDAGHNYNTKSREAVYPWFDKWLMGNKSGTEIRDATITGLDPKSLRVFPKGMPKGTLQNDELLNSLIAHRKKQIEDALSGSRRKIRKYRRQYGADFPCMLAVKAPSAIDASSWGEAHFEGGTSLFIGREGKGDRVPVRVYGKLINTDKAVLVVTPDGHIGFEKIKDRYAPLLAAGYCICVPDLFNTGDAIAVRERGKKKYFTTYNRTDTSNRIQDILTCMAWLKKQESVNTIHLSGHGDAGLWCLLAVGLADFKGSVIADAACFDNHSDDAYIERLFIPGLRRIGDFQTAAALTAPRNLLIYNTGESFDIAAYRKVYEQAGAKKALEVIAGSIADKQLCSRLLKWK
jgi:dienelactone hydrolase